MVRVWAAVLASVFLAAEIFAQTSTEGETAYVIEIGAVSYDRGLPSNAVKAFEEDLRQRGEPVPTRYSDLKSLAYEQLAQETSRVALTFVLRVGDVSIQDISMPDSSVFAQVKLLSADDNNLTASITSRFSGRVVRRTGGGSSSGSSRKTRIPLDDREHHTAGASSFALFPNGGGQGETRRQYVRARLATPEDFEQKKLDRGVQLPPGIVAKLEANPPRFLALDERWAWLKLVTPSEYDDYATLDKLEEILKEKMTQETERVHRICGLQEEQAEKLDAAFLRYRVQVQRDAFALEAEALRNPRLQAEEAREFRSRLAKINELLHQSYFTEGSLTDAILRSHLDDEQLEKLEKATLDEFVTALAGSDFNWDEGQTEKLRSHLVSFVNGREDAVLDHQLLLDTLTGEFLSELLDPQQVKMFEFTRGVSAKAHYFLLNISR